MQPQSLEIVAIEPMFAASFDAAAIIARALALAAVIAQHSPAVRAFVVVLWAA